MPNPFLEANPFLLRAANRVPPLSPEVEDSLLSYLAGGGMSALSMVGNVFDTPGAFIRTSLAGENPFPGIFDTSQRIGGRELLEQYGVLGPNEEGFDLGDVGGFAAEVALDPLTYMTLGASALTKTGKAANLLGHLAPAKYGAGGKLLQGAREAQMLAGQRAAIGFGIPFMEPIATAGTGPIAQGFARGLDTAGDYLRFGNPVGLTLGGLFDSRVKGQTSRVGQIAEIENAARTAQLEAETLGQVYKGVIDPLRRADMLGNDPALRTAMREGVELGQPLPDELAAAAPAVERMRELFPEWLGTEREAGVMGGELQDIYGDYSPRGKTSFAVESGGRQKSLSPDQPFQIQRKDPLRNVPGMTEQINRMSLDPLLSGETAAVAAPKGIRAAHIRKQYLDFDDGQFYALNQEMTTLRGQLAKASAEGDAAGALAAHERLGQVRAELAPMLEPWRKGFQLADELGDLPEQHLKEGVPLFGNSVVHDVLQRGIQHARSLGASEGIMDLLAKNAVSERGPGMVSVLEVLQKANMAGGFGEALTPDGADVIRLMAMEAGGNVGEDVAQQIAENIGEIASRPEYKTIATEAVGAIPEMQKRLGGRHPGAMFVPEDVAEVPAKMLKGFQSPEAVSSVISLLDKYSNAFKVGVLAWPSRFVRDLYSGQYMNWANGTFSWRGLTGADSILRKGLQAEVKSAELVPEFASRGLTRQQATQEFVKEMFAQRLLPSHGGGFNEIVGPAKGGQTVLGQIPGGKPMSLHSTLIEPLGQEGWWKPTRTRGVGLPGQTVNESQFFISKISENIGSYTDGLNRIAPYVEARMQGYAPAEAFRKVTLAQVDYSAMTPFEKNVMKRVAPFYSWTRRMIPAVLKELSEHPGGRMTQTIRAARLSREDEFLPPHVSQGLAIGIGELPTGEDRYLTQIDLPQESVLGLFRPSNTLGGTAVGTLQALASQLNPIIKAPLEYATDRSFYSGRPLSELDSRIGRAINPDTPPQIPTAIDQLVGASPLSRLVSAVGTLSDPRKGVGAKAVNLLTGVRVTDVDTERTRDRTAQEGIEELLQGNPQVKQFESLYVPEAERALLSPEDQALMQAYKSIQGRYRERAEQRRALQGAGRL